MNNSKLDYDNKDLTKEFQEKFHEIFPYYDYVNLLTVIKLWVADAKLKYNENNITNSNRKIAHVLSIMDVLLARIINDTYYDHIRTFKLDKYQFKYDGSDNSELKSKILKRTYNIAELRKKQDIEYLFLLFKRYVLVIWD